MDNAIVPSSSQALTVNDGSFPARLAALSARNKLMLVSGIAALAAIITVLSLWSNPGDYKVLYANLSDKDGGAIIGQLSQMNIPYKYTDGGTAILVPAGQVHDARLRLASAGLPKGGTVGFELMDNARFGQTQFQERLTFQRGLEGELVRSITSLAAVQAARVHLALPAQNGFMREQQKPSASVVLTLYPGRALERAQIAGIVHLVSSSVPDMAPSAVSVLDQTGALLSSPSDGNNGLDAQQLQYVNQIEGNYSKRIADILEPVIGRDNLRATVTAEVDFSQSESTTEQFKPNQGNEPSAVRSLQVSESNNSTGATPSGVPGATSNQPPVPATAPVNGQAQALHAAQTGGGGSGNARRDNVTNYELDKTVRVTRNATGLVKRLNAAVVINDHVKVNPTSGKVSTSPQTSEEMEKLTALVQQAMGFNKDRGDSVRVINASFKMEQMPKPEDAPFWQAPWLQDLLRAAVMPVALAVVGLVVAFTLVKPALKAALAPVPGARLSAVVDEPMPPPALEAPKNIERLNNARALAKENPQAVAGIVRGWVSGESS